MSAFGEIASGRARRRDQSVAQALLGMMVALILLPLAGIIGLLIVRGAPALSIHFLLDNPVTVEDETDWNGLWFARYLNRRYKPGVMLYDAPPGWLWAGWVIYRGHALRTGKFRNGGDNDDWSGYSGRTGESPLIDPA